MIGFSSSGGGGGNTANQRSGSVSVAVAGTTVTFSTPYADTNWYVDGFDCRDSTGGMVLWELTNKTVNGFLCTPTTAATLSYTTNHA